MHTLGEIKKEASPKFSNLIKDLSSFLSFNFNTSVFSIVQADVKVQISCLSRVMGILSHHSAHFTYADYIWHGAVFF